MALAITSFTPASADGAGGTVVTLTGTQLDTAEAFLVGSKQAQVVGTTTATTATIRVPAMAAGAYKIAAVDQDTGAVAQSASTLTVTAAASPVHGGLTGAGKWAVEVDLSVAQDGTGYAKVRSLTNVVPKLDQTTQDTSYYEDYDTVSGLSWGSAAPTQLKWSLELSFDRSTFGSAPTTYDPAQEAVRFAAENGRSKAQVRVRWYDRAGGPEAYEGFATTNWAEQGGSTDAKSMVQATLTGLGQRKTITNPAA